MRPCASSFGPTLTPGVPQPPGRLHRAPRHRAQAPHGAPARPPSGRRRHVHRHEDDTAETLHDRWADGASGPQGWSPSERNRAARPGSRPDLCTPGRTHRPMTHRSSPTSRDLEAARRLIARRLSPTPVGMRAGTAREPVLKLECLQPTADPDGLYRTDSGEPPHRAGLRSARTAQPRRRGQAVGDVWPTAPTGACP